MIRHFYGGRGLNRVSICFVRLNRGPLTLSFRQVIVDHLLMDGFQSQGSILHN